MAEQPVTLAGLLRELRVHAGLTQEELAAAAALSPRSVSDLERGVNRTARRDTVRLLADALNLTGAVRADFEAVARGRVPAAGVDREAATASAGRGPALGSAAATRTLPRDIASFTGRESELRELAEAAARVAGPDAVVGIHAVGGMAGVGKTAFAVHAAHRLAPRFPGGQIFVPLHGHTPGRRPVDPADALATLLQTAGVPAGQIPPGLEARTALWRDRLAGRPLLLVLDDAASSDQVRPLLPGTGGTLVLVTSRRHLSALEDTWAISLDTLPPDEAASLLVRLAARPELSPDDPAVSDVVRLCGYLPLAVGMLARQLHHHPAWAAGDLAADLAAARDRLELLQAEDLSVTAAFNLSYQDLTEAQQQLFRRLGLHPGTDVDAYAAAALDGTSLATARRQLEALYDHYLLTEPTRGRYRPHDLIRAHAQVLAASQDPGRDRDEAAGRLFGYLGQAAAAADRHFSRYTRPGHAAASAPHARLPELPELPTRDRALAWARTEHANLLACLDQAVRTEDHAWVVALTAAMAGFLRHDSPWTDALAFHAAAVQAARTLGDRLGEANARHDQAAIQRLTGDYLGAADSLQAALDLYRDVGEPLGEANALEAIGIVRYMTGDNREATDILQAALGLYRTQGDSLGQAIALLDLGVARRLADDYPAAAAAMEAALELYRELGDLLGSARTLIELGMVRTQIGDYRGAIDAFETGLRISQQTSDRLGQVNALNNLGLVRQLTGDYPGAADVLEAALSISRDIGNRLGHANALKNLAIVRRATGDYDAAAGALDAALRIYRELGNRMVEALALNEAGILYRELGDLDQARAFHQRARELALEVNCPADEASALAGLGRCALAEGHVAEARASLRGALEIFQRIGAAESAEVAAELDALSTPDPSPR